MSDFHLDDPVFYRRLEDFTATAMHSRYVHQAYKMMLLDSSPPNQVKVRVSVVRLSDRLSKIYIEKYSKVIVFDPSDSDDVIIATIRDAFGKLPEPKLTICVECENYVGPSLTALRGCPDAALPGPTRCVPYLDNTLDPMTGDRKRGAAVSCNWRNPDGKCKHYSRKEKRTPSNGTRQEEAGSKEEAEQTDREV